MLDSTLTSKPPFEKQMTPEKKEATTSQELTAIDRELIMLTQAGLPRVSKPYHQIADALSISADEVMARLKKMQASGVIRRIAAVPNHYKLGYKHNGMTVWDVPDEKVSELGKLVGGLAFVSHCYQRPRYLPTWRYNLFAMVHGKSSEEVNELIEKIKTVLGDDLRANDVLFSTKILKKTGLRIRDKSD